MTELILKRPLDSDPAYRRGALLVLFAAVVWSFSGLIFRSIEAAEPWEIIFYRSAGIAAGVTVAMLLRYRWATLKAFRAVGWPGLAAAFCLAGSTIGFLQALHYTTIANISFMAAAHPFFAAAMAWVLLGERVAWRTWVAAALALVGVLMMVSEGLAVGGLFGNLLALVAGIMAAGYTVALRFGRGRDMTPAVALSGLVALIITAPFVVDFQISWRDLGLCLLQGLVISAFCNSIFAYAARAVPAAELSLLSLLETVLAPTWVWLVIAETPSAITLLGGAVILSAVLGHAYSSVRAKPGGSPPSRR